MDKKYYSNKHRKYNKNKKSKLEKSAFLMRLNLSLGIAIVSVGIYKLNNDFSKNFTDTYKKLVSDNISFSVINETVEKLSDLGRSVTTFAYSDRDSVILDKSTLDYINNSEDTYIINNTPAKSP